MSATNTTPDVSGAVAVDSTNTNTSVDPAKQEALQKMAAENEAKRIEKVAVQRRKAEVAHTKAAQELASKGKNAILKAQPSRPSRRPVKKNRKPLPPPANRNHDNEVTVEKIRTSAEEKRLAPLRVVRLSYSYSDIVEQRVVDGVVECIIHTNHSVNESCAAHNHDDGIVQRMADSVTEPIFQSSDAPGIAHSDDDMDSDKATGSGTASDEDVPQLLRETASPNQVTEPEDRGDSIQAAGITALPHICMTTPMDDADEEASMSETLAEAVDNSSELIKDKVSGKSPCSPLAILSMTNSTLYPPRLSRDEEPALIAMHVFPVVLPVAEVKQQKLTKAGKKVIKTTEASKKVATVDSDLVQKLPEPDSAMTAMDPVEPVVIGEESTYVATLLGRPNGSGLTKKSRHLHEKPVTLHIASLSLPVTALKQQKTSNTEQKANKIDKKNSVATEKKDPDFIDSLLCKPNGPGETKETRNLHNNLVAKHVAPLEFSVLEQQHKDKKSRKVKKSIEPSITEPDAVGSPILNMGPMVTEGPASAIEELSTDDATRDEPSIVIATPIQGFWQTVLSTATATEIKDKLQHVKANTVEQTVIIPDSALTTTPPISDRNDSSSESDTFKSFRTSSRSSAHSSASIRRKAEKARTTFLGGISLETFINTLDFELWDGTTTKDDICEAFASLAGHTIYALDKPKIQRKIKLGSTSLYVFLRQITFIEDEVTVVGEVMKVFRKAARGQVISPELEVALWLAEETSEGDGSLQGRCSRRSSLAGGA
ncbi:hypothetical protein BKA58DRAFT_468038 [Alternaria rosae]|uniref:uncharacterized protein n=1 Tax=Alternaria rosae TaxID=1187941 RepID=UPI001E8D2C16|nr:uncharacterized protein BKA58DRAFT_468038 [Alternaria rosae]KAH6872221.1 hypothetical protein BKA58DRAFT_468038 [Alternaria rosae]